MHNCTLYKLCIYIYIYIAGKLNYTNNDINFCKYLKHIIILIIIYTYIILKLVLFS